VTFRTSVVTAGRATTQVQVTGTVGDKLVLTALGALTDRPAGDEQHFGTMPAAPSPADCVEFTLPMEAVEHANFFDAMERRLDVGSMASLAETGRFHLWVRMPTWPGPSRAMLAHVADVVPIVFFLAQGKSHGGTSLDNTLRVVDDRTTEWTLMEVEGHGYSRSIGHGQVRMWSEDGRLLAIASQSAIIRTSHLTTYA
jgi:acyl-CoA thioesterase